MSAGPETLPEARVGPYLRALSAGLHALAPDEDHVPLAECEAHLQALDPACSGDLLSPARLSPSSGLPATGWLRRALAEQELAHADPDPSAEVVARAVARALAVDPALAERLSRRASLRALLRGRSLIPLRRLEAAWRGARGVSLRFDHVAVDGRWTRLRAELELRERPLAALRGDVRALGDGRVQLSPSVESLLLRHAEVPLEGLHPLLERALDARVLRLSRGRLGPFWFPGWVPGPGAPQELLSGLLLHLSLELLSTELSGYAQADPLPAPALPLPEGLGAYRERRFAASANLRGPLERWCAAADAACELVLLQP